MKIFKTKTEENAAPKVLAWDSNSEEWVIRSYSSVIMNAERYTHWASLPGNPADMPQWKS